MTSLTDRQYRPRNFQVSDHYKSKAHIRTINKFYLGEYDYIDNPEAVNGYDAIWKPENGFISKWPMIIDGQGMPWDIGNSYLLSKFTNKLPDSTDGIISTAKGLLTFLKWLEDNEKHYLHLPSKPREKVTYQFVVEIKRLVSLGMAPSTGERTWLAVSGFYQDLVTYGLIDESTYPNMPFDIIQRSILVLNRHGLPKIKDVKSPSIGFRAAKSDHAPVGQINDGENLIPLTRVEQLIFRKALQLGYTSNISVLQYLTALYTGARQQTFCTLKVRDVVDMYGRMQDSLKRLENGAVMDSAYVGKSDPEVSIRPYVDLIVGGDQSADTKYNKVHRLIFPFSLVERLYMHVTSELHLERMERSHYGVSDYNYVFLTDQGNAYYTSRSEEREFQEAEKHWSSNSPQKGHKRGFKQQDGNTVRANLNTLVTKIQTNFDSLKSEVVKDLDIKVSRIMQVEGYEADKYLSRQLEETESLKEAVLKTIHFRKFKCHDLRATFGVNLVEILESKGYKSTRILDELRKRMGHTNRETSQRYIDFRELSELKDYVGTEFENQLLDQFEDRYAKVNNEL